MNKSKHSSITALAVPKTTKYQKVVCLRMYRTMYNHLTITAWTIPKNTK